MMKLEMPSGLFGRDHEIEIIREAYRRVRDGISNNLGQNIFLNSILVEGDSGTGKSALVEAALKDYVEQDQGWYITGKFDQIKSHRPFSAFIDALNSLCLEAIAREEAQPTRKYSAKFKPKHNTGTTDTGGNDLGIVNFDSRSSDSASNSQVSFIDGQPQVLSQQEEAAIHILFALVPNLSKVIPSGKVFNGSAPLPFKFVPSDASESCSHSSSSGSDSRGALKNIQMKLKALIIDILRVIAKDKCIVLLIEDLQWGDIDTINLILHLVNNVNDNENDNNNNNTKLLFVGTFRSEPTLGLRDHYLWTQIHHEFNNKNKNNDDDKNNKNKKTNNGDSTDNSPSPQVVSISSLSLNHVTSFVASTLQIKNESSKVLPLSELIYERTNGNILFVQQYLQLLHSNGHIYYSHENFCWEWEDVATIQDSGRLVKGDDVIAVIEAKIQKLPRNTIEALQLASCLGGRFDLDVIEFVTQQWWEEYSTTKTPVTGDDEGDDIACILWPAVEIELLEEVGVASFTASSQYKFTHDKIQSAAYEMLEKDEKRKCHLCVGNSLEKLYQKPSGQLWMLILSASNLFKAMDPLTSSQESRDRVATINYNAALELKANATFESAAIMSQNALELVGDGNEIWERDYQLSLDVHNLRAEMEYCTGHLEKCEESVSKILEYAHDKRDKYDAYDLKVGCLSSKRQYDEALDATLLFLRQMKFCRFPSKVTPVHVVTEIFRAKRELKGLDDETLLNLPYTEDEDAASFVKTMMKGVLVAFIVRQKMAMLFMSMRLLRISLKSGCTPYSPTAFALCGLVHAKLGKLKEAYRFGRIGMELTRRVNAPEANWLCGMIYYLFLDHLYNECADYTNFFTQLHDMGTNTANAIMACSLGGTEVGVAWYSGMMHLDSLIPLTSIRIEEQIEHDMWAYIPITRMVRQKALNLAGRSRDPTFLEGDEIKDLSEFMRQNANDPVTQLQQWWACLEVATWFGDTTRGEVMAKKISTSWKKDFPVFSTMWMVFFKGLMWCWIYNEKKISGYKKKAKQELKILRGWVKDGLKNRDCFLLFLEAEYLALDRGKSSTEDINIVKDAYDKTLERMSNYGLPHVTALVAERAGRSLKRLHPKDDETANQYLRASLDGYKVWGAWGKVRQLVQEFDCLSGELESLSFSSPGYSRELGTASNKKLEK